VNAPCVAIVSNYRTSQFLPIFSHSMFAHNSIIIRRAAAARAAWRAGWRLLAPPTPGSPARPTRPPCALALASTARSTWRTCLDQRRLWRATSPPSLADAWRPMLVSHQTSVDYCAFCLLVNRSFSSCNVFLFPDSFLSPSPQSVFTLATPRK
jgi:hypothetical protein